jgi:hypothetical protein
MQKPEPEPAPSKRSTKMALVVIGLGVAGQVVRDARTREALIVIAIVVAAAAALARESGNKSVNRLKAWDTKVTGKVKAAAAVAVDTVTPESD